MKAVKPKLVEQLKMFEWCRRHRIGVEYVL